MERSQSANNALGLELPPAANWRYRIEGSQKALFSLAPFPSQLRQEPPEPPPDALCVYTSLLNPHSRLQNPYSPQEQVLFRRFLSPFLIQPRPVMLPRAYLSELASEADPYRPPTRHSQSSIATASGQAELLPDIALRFGPETILVEVKPKSGVLSRSALVHPDVTTALRKFDIPVYHLKNYVFPNGVSGKLGVMPDINFRYNPVELLSGLNIRRHLLNLHKTRSRSLRVFSGGRLLTHSISDQRCNDGICMIAMDVAARVLAGGGGGEPQRKSCLSGVREIQNMDYVDNIGAAFLLDRLVRLVGKARAHKMISMYLYGEDDENENEDSLPAALVAKRMVSYETSAEAARLHSVERYERAVKNAMDLEPRFLAMMVADFLQAAAAKDCSIMVALCRRADAAFTLNSTGKDEVSRLVISDDEEWVYSVHVVDTGEKSIDKILNKWAAIDLQRKHRINASGSLERLR